MLRLGGLWRTVLRRARADGSVVLGAWSLLACAATLLAAGTIYGETVARSSIRRAYLAAPAVQRSIVVDLSSPAGRVAALDTTVTRLLEGALASTGGGVGLVAQTGPFTPADGPPGDPAHQVSVGTYGDLSAHAVLVSGRWPAPGRAPLEATLSQAAARSLGVVVGGRLRLASLVDPGLAIEATITGLWRPDAGDPYWLDDPLIADGVATSGRYTTRGPLVLTRPDMLALPVAHGLDVQWRASPDPANLTADGLGALAADVQALPATLPTALPPDQQANLTTQLPVLLATLQQDALISRAGILILTLQFAVLAGYAVLLVGGMLVERRRVEAALLRSRGATSGHMAALALGEGVLLAVPAVVVAPWLALGGIRLLGAVGPLAGQGLLADARVDTTSVLVAALGGLGAMLALSVPALLSGTTPAAIRAVLARPGASTFQQRLGLDLALTAVAGLALWQLRLYGAPLTRDVRGRLGIDPLLVAAPAIGLLAGAVLATRLLPRLAEIAERLLARRRDLVLSLGARQLARRPLRYTRSALLLMLAAALAMFSAVYAATWSRSQADQAAYQAAADVRVMDPVPGDLPAWATGPALRSLAGVRAALPVADRALEVGTHLRDGQLLALDARAATSVMTVAPAGLASLASNRAATPAIRLPDDARRLAVTLDVALGAGTRAGATEPLPAGEGSVAVAAVLEGPEGLERLDLGAVSLAGRDQRAVAPLTAALAGADLRAAGPLRLEAVELTLAPPAGVEVAGSLVVRGVATSAGEDGQTWQALPLDPAAAGWGWDRVDATRIRAYTPPGAPGELLLGEGPGAAGPVVADPPKDPGVTFRLLARPASATVLPALVDPMFLELTGARLGDTVDASSSGYGFTLRLMGSVPDFAPLDPGRAFAVVDGPSLALADYVAWDRLAGPEEWWLAVPGADDVSRVAATLRQPPWSANEVIARAELARSLAGEPVPLGVIGALALGSLAALVMAGVAYVVSSTVTTGERAGEIALLRALGLSSRALGAWLVLESGFLLTVAVVAGTALGLFLAWLVLPFASLTPDGSPAVPPAVVVVPWSTLVPLVAVVAGLAVIVVLLAVRRLRGVGIGGMLRAGSE